MIESSVDRVATGVPWKLYWKVEKLHPLDSLMLQIDPKTNQYYEPLLPYQLQLDPVDDRTIKFSVSKPLLFRPTCHVTYLQPPNLVSVVGNASVWRELSHSGGWQDAHFCPPLGITVRLFSHFCYEWLKLQFLRIAEIREEWRIPHLPMLVLPNMSSNLPWGDSNHFLARSCSTTGSFLQILRKCL